MTSSFEGLLTSREILICCGSGGVGKTSIAAAAGIAAAGTLGGRVLVVTVDPARRLAAALGLGDLGNDATRIPDDAFDAPPRGELWMAMLDTKQSWDDLVRRHAPDAATRDRILTNRLYEELTSRFIQSHDYVAMERLYELHRTGEYDLIIIDTPPTRNAIDFLDAPERMADFFGGKLLRVLTAPYRAGSGRAAKMLDFASRPFLALADRVLGAAFLSDIAEFFLNFQTMYNGFVERARAVEALLHDPRCGFLVVTTLDPAPAREATRFIGELHAREFELCAVVQNKVLPSEYAAGPARRTGLDIRERADSIAQHLAEENRRGLSDPDRTARVLRTVGTAFEQLHLAALRESERASSNAFGAGVRAQVPLMSTDVRDVSTLSLIARALLSR